MRFSGTILGLVAMAALGACGSGSGGGGDAERQAFITKAEESCVQAAQKGTPPPGVDVRGFCSCAINRMAEGKSEAQLRDLDKQAAPTPADVAVMRQCMTEATKTGGK